MKVYCAPKNKLTLPLFTKERVFALFDQADRAGFGTIARGWKSALAEQGFSPNAQVWDFVQVCLSVCAADMCSPRNTSADGWTRNIELVIALCEPERWAARTKHIEEMLRVLSGDFWTLSFIDGGAPPPKADQNPKPNSNDCVSLLSGGLDSLVGGIDAVANGHRPLFVSQLAHEDSDRQRQFANILGSSNHIQWNHAIQFSGTREPSTRARSLAFYAFAVLAATKISLRNTKILVPENGFISINPPLLPGRISSLSTRTTHPLFLSKLQQLVDDLGIGVKFQMPYQFKTKGQMLQECKDQALLRDWASRSTSCGRFRVYNRTHCGRCLPCMIRRAAFLAWDKGSDLTNYKFPNLTRSAKSSGPDDPMAAALAVLAVRESGLDRFLGSALAFAPLSQRQNYRQVLQLGCSELEALLKHDGLL